MATSGSKDFTVSRDELIAGALRLLGQLDFRQTPSVLEYTAASQALNMMVKSWQNRDIGLWLNSFATLHLDTTSESYSLSTSGDRAAYVSYITTTSAAASSGASTITVTTDDNMTASDAIGIELEDGTMQWTTISGTPSSNVVTLAAVLTDDVDSGAVVYNYTSKMDRPLDIIEARVRDANDDDTPIQIVTRADYLAIADKDSAGKPNQLYYDPLLTTGKVYLWPVNNSVENRIHMTVKIPIDDFDAAANNAQFPVEWLRALKYNLAVELAPEYMTLYMQNPKVYRPINTRQMQMIRETAAQTLAEAEIFDTEIKSIQMIPDLSGYY